MGGKCKIVCSIQQESFDCSNEYTGDYNQLLYLRARSYAPEMGRFLTRDTWKGDINSPLSLNQWNYVEGNPINYADPTGLIKQSEADEAQQVVNKLQTYRVFVNVDWGERNYWYNDPIDSSKSGTRCGWNEGEWELNELKEIKKGVVDLSNSMGGLNKFTFNFGYVDVDKTPLGSDLARGGLHALKVNNNNHSISRWVAVHELGHVWDANYGWGLSKDLVILTAQYGKVHAPVDCGTDPRNKLPGCNNARYVYVDVLAFGSDGRMNPREDFANSVAAYVYPVYSQSQIQKYQTLDQGKYADYLYYTDYRTTLRWRIIDALVRSTNNSQPR